MTRMLTRDERHMLSAALDVLRRNVLDQPGRRGGVAAFALLDAQLRLDVADDYARAQDRTREWTWSGVLAAALRDERPSGELPRPERRRRERILRARLAMAIRAVLRADRGEDRHRVGPCSACDGSGIGDYARDPSTGEW